LPTILGLCTAAVLSGRMILAEITNWVGHADSELPASRQARLGRRHHRIACRSAARIGGVVLPELELLGRPHRSIRPARTGSASPNDTTTCGRTCHQLQRGQRRNERTPSSRGFLIGVGGGVAGTCRLRWIAKRRILSWSTISNVPWAWPTPQRGWRPRPFLGW